MWSGLRVIRPDLRRGSPEGAGRLEGVDGGPDVEGEEESEPSQGFSAVLGLAPGLVGLGDQAGRAVTEDDGGLDFVAVLAAGTGASEGRPVAVGQEMVVGVGRRVVARGGTIGRVRHRGTEVPEARTVLRSRGPVGRGVELGVHVGGSVIVNQPVAKSGLCVRDVLGRQPGCVFVERLVEVLRAQDRGRGHSRPQMHPRPARAEYLCGDIK